MLDATFVDAVEIVAAQIRHIKHLLDNPDPMRNDDLAYQRFFVLYSRALSPVFETDYSSLLARLPFASNEMATLLSYYFIHHALSLPKLAASLLEQQEVRASLGPAICHSLLTISPSCFPDLLITVASQYMSDPDHTTRLFGANLALYMTQLPPEILQLLLTLLSDKDAATRLEAIRSLLHHHCSINQCEESLHELRRSSLLSEKQIADIDNLLVRCKSLVTS